MKDFAKKKPTSKTTLFDVQKILLLVLMGLIIATLLTVAAKITRMKTAVYKKPVAAKVVNPTFDFYSLLPEMSVKSKVNQTRFPLKPANSAPKPHPGNTTQSYNLQVASLKNAAQAKTLMARLTMLGMNCRIQTVQQDHITWQRVIVGPFNNRLDAEKNQAFLNQQHIDALIVTSK